MTDVLPPAWTQAVRSSPFPVAVADLEIFEVVEANTWALRIFEHREGHPVSVADGIPIFVADRDLAAMVRSGRLDGFETHVSFRTATDAELEVRVWVRTAAGDVPRRYALVIASEELPGQDLIGPPARDGAVVTGATDRDWTVSWATTDVTDVLGYELSDFVGTPLLGLVAPETAADVVAALSHAADLRRGAVVDTRVRNAAGDWRAVRVIVSPSPLSAPGTTFVMAPIGGGAPDASELAVAIHRRLEQLVRDVHLAGLAQSSDRVGPASDVAADLSSRQWEIVVRLRRGERVPDIARSMHLSQSTVRNHLTAVFRKFGVRSQAELLASLRSDVDPGGSV